MQIRRTRQRRADAGGLGRRAAVGRFAALALAALALAGALFALGCQRQDASDEASQPEKAPQESEATDQVKEGPDADYLLILGDDSWEKYTPGHSDMMMLVRMDFKRDQISFVSIPRDTSYTWSDGTVIKANMAYQIAGGGEAGAEAACKAASDITGVKVDKYLVVGFGGFQSIVDRVGGLELDLPYAIDYSFYTHDYPDESFAAGPQTLTPWRAMALSRARTGYDPYGLSEDMMRQIVDRQMLVQLTKRLFSDPAQTAPLMKDLLGSVSTNVPTETLLSWASDFSAADQIVVYGTSGPVDGGIDPATKAWLVPPAPEKWKALMDVVDAGGDPSTVNAQFEGNVQSDIAPINSKTVIEKH